MTFLDAKHALNSLTGAAVLGDSAPSAEERVLRGACYLPVGERHQFAIKLLSEKPAVQARFITVFETFLQNMLSADNIDKRHFGAYVEMCAAIGRDMFGHGKSVVEGAYTSVERKLPFWMKKKFEDLNVVYFGKTKQGHSGSSSKQVAKKNARAANDRSVRNAMRGNSGGGGGNSQQKGSKKKK